MISDTIYNVNINFDEYENEIQPNQSIDFYLKFAEKCIAKYADQNYPHLSREMLSSEDAISEIAYCVMCADTKWKSDGGMKLNSWRIEQAKLGIQKYVNRKNRKHNMTTYNIVDPLLATSGQPPTSLYEFENQEFAQVMVQKIMNGSGLTEKEAEAAKLRSEGYTYREIGAKLHCSDENARLLNNKAINKMSQHVADRELTWC